MPESLFPINQDVAKHKQAQEGLGIVGNVAQDAGLGRAGFTYGQGGQKPGALWPSQGPWETTTRNKKEYYKNCSTENLLGPYLCTDISFSMCVKFFFNY
jgi:hypothetical protein